MENDLSVLEGQSLFLAKNMLYKKMMKCDLNQSIFYPQLGNIALISVLIPKLLFVNCTVAAAHKCQAKADNFSETWYKAYLKKDKQQKIFNNYLEVTLFEKFIVYQ